jgi:hypothetical protein
VILLLMALQGAPNSGDAVLAAARVQGAHERVLTVSAHH